MTDTSNPKIAALQPLIDRVRTDVTARLIPREGGGKSAVWDKATPLTTEILAKHLNGGPARGVALMQPGSDVTLVAVLDLDSHKGEVPWGEMAATGAMICDALSLAWGMDPIAFRSSGGRGVHIYLLWDDPQPAWAVRAWLGEVLQACGLRAGVGSLAEGVVEVFPRQDRVRAGGFGNQVFLPLAGESEPLAVEDLSGMLVAAPVETLAWPASPPIPARERPAPATPTSPADTGEVWRQALEALPNDATRSLSYEDWLRVVHAVHYETDGSDEGQETARAWSARSPKHERRHAGEGLDARQRPRRRRHRRQHPPPRAAVGLARPRRRAERRRLQKSWTPHPRSPTAPSRPRPPSGAACPRRSTCARTRRTRTGWSRPTARAYWSPAAGGTCGTACAGGRTRPTCTATPAACRS